MLYTVLILIGFMAFVVCAALVFASMNRMSNRLEGVEAKLGVTAQSFWVYVMSVVSKDLIHPHKRYEEMDDLVREALFEPVTTMPPERLRRLEQLLDARSADTSDDMRPGEQVSAQIFKLAIVRVRQEFASDKELSDFTLVGSQKPEVQKGEDPK